MRAIRIMIVGMLLTAALGCASRRGSERQDEGEYKQLTAYIDSLKISQAAEAMAAEDFVIGMERAQYDNAPRGELRITDQSRNFIEVKNNRLIVQTNFHNGIGVLYGSITNKKMTEDNNGNTCFNVCVITALGPAEVTMKLKKNSNYAEAQVRTGLFQSYVYYFEGTLIPSRLARLNRSGVIKDDFYRI